MRRKDREICNLASILEIIASCKVCRVAFIDEQGLYIVPLNFGYLYEDGMLTLYFHSAKEGRKIKALSENPEVCFEMDCEHQLIEGKKACDYAYSYKSIIGNGKASVVQIHEEKKLALKLLMKHQADKDFDFTEKETSTVCIFKIKSENMTAKCHKMP